jgi:hypothetical protein
MVTALAHSADTFEQPVLGARRREWGLGLVVAVVLAAVVFDRRPALSIGPPWPPGHDPAIAAGHAVSCSAWR